MPRKSRKHLPQEVPSTPRAVKYATWGYARISNDNARSEDSIENQSAIIQEYTTDKADLDLRGVITDLGFTGTNFNRPGYAKLMNGIENGSVQCIIIKDISRVGRSYLEVGELLFNTLPTYNVRIISINDQYDSFSDDVARKKLFMIFKNLVNHMYSQDLGIKIRSSHALKQQKGELLGSMPPYGYMFTSKDGGKRLETEPESAKIVKLIFDMRVKGDSMVKITNYLNQNGISSPRNHYHYLGVLPGEKNAKKALWQNSYIGHLLRNEVYLGNQIQGKYKRRENQVSEKPREEWIVHENTHPAIINKEQFDTVQKLLAEAGEKYKRHGNKLDENIFVGRVFCSRCGKALKRQYSRTKIKTHYYYNCPACNYEIRQSKRIEKLPRLSLKQLEDITSTILQKEVDACIDIVKLIKEISASSTVINKRNILTAKLNRCQQDSKKADDMLATAYTHHLAGLLDSKEFELARKKFERDKSVAEVNAEQVANELNKCDTVKAQQSAYLTSFQGFKGFVKLDKDIINALIHRIDISPLTNEISIVLNFMNELEELNSLIEESEVLTDV